MFNPGEIVLAVFPYSNLGASKRRPCVVLARADTPDEFVVTYITSVGKAARLPSALPISRNHPQWNLTGLKVDSVIRADKLVTLDLSVIAGAVGTLPADLLRDLRSKLKTLLQIP